MRKLFYIVSLLFFGAVSAQTDPKSAIPEKPIDTKPQGDSLSSNSQLTKESDLKTMDAVKTHDHKKTTRKETATITVKDTAINPKATRTGTKKALP